MDTTIIKNIDGMMVSGLQLNLTVGDFEGNYQKILAGYLTSCEMGADLVVCSELTLFGYPAGDLLLRKGYLEKQDKYFRILRDQIGDVGLFLGVAMPNLSAGKSLHNGAVLLVNRVIKGVWHKTLLPNYDVFDERRYFEPRGGGKITVVEYRGKRLAVLICEDLWGSQSVQKSLYDRNPVAALDMNLDLLITMNASPYYWGKANVRYQLFSSIARTVNCPVIYVNQVGGNDGLIFDGHSFIVDRFGNFVAIGPAFCEGIMIADVFNSGVDFEFVEGISCLRDALVLGLRDYVNKSGFEKVLVAVSGGIDSAIVAWLATLALGRDRVIGVSLPSDLSSQDSKDDARELARNLGIQFETISIGVIYDLFGAVLRPKIGWYIPGTVEGDVTEENIQARIRGVIMMALSNRMNAMLLSTGNKSETAVGYCTLYGDTTGGLAVIGDVLKTNVYELAKLANADGEVIPWNTIKKPPTADLRPNQKDEDSLPPYPILDKILQMYIEEEKDPEIIIASGCDPELVRWIVGKVDSNEYKRRQMPPCLKVTEKAFGSGRRLPIVAKYL